MAWFRSRRVRRRGERFLIDLPETERDVLATLPQQMRDLLAPGLAVWAKFVTVPEDAQAVEVLGQQWAWTYRFPGRDGELGASDSNLISIDNPFGLDPNDPVGRGHTDVGRDQRFLERVERFEIDRAAALPRLVCRARDLVEPVDELFLGACERCPDAIEKTHGLSVCLRTLRPQHQCFDGAQRRTAAVEHLLHLRCDGQLDAVPGAEGRTKAHRLSERPRARGAVLQQRQEIRRPT